MSVYKALSGSSNLSENMPNDAQCPVSNSTWDVPIPEDLPPRSRTLLYFLPQSSGL